MDKAKSVVSDFLGGKDKHDVSVEEHTAPALLNETVHKHQHHETQTAVDKEIHKTHHHTTLQPVRDSEVRPEVHEHAVHGVEERVHHHGDNSQLERGLAAEKEKFRDRQHVMPTTTSEARAPDVVGEHVHHHVIETVQPVIQKDTHQNTTVHHVKPVHEVHHHAAQHHEATALPAVSMDQFRSQGGSLTGGTTTHDNFTGHKDIEGVLGHASGIGSSTGTSGVGSTGTHGVGHSSSGGAGPHHSSTANRADPRVDSDGSKGLGAGATSGSGLSSNTGTGYGSSNTTGSGLGSSNTTGSGLTGSHHNTSGTSNYGTSSGGTGPHNSSLLNKADPRVDSDGSKGYGAGATSGSGTTTGQSSTGHVTSGGAGPHSSTTGNVLDPRVDSDGSKGYGTGARS